jgi:hypothetical protein
MTTIPWGLMFFAWCTLMAVAPMRRPRRLAVVSWISSLALNEVPYLFLYTVIASTVPTVVGGDLGGIGSWISLGLAGLTVAGLIVVARRALRTGAVVDRAMAGVGHLGAVSSNPVVYAELPGAQHSFDLFHSVRFETVIDAIEAFAAWVRSPDSSRLKEAARHD